MLQLGRRKAEEGSGMWGGGLLCPPGISGVEGRNVDKWPGMPVMISLLSQAKKHL